MAADGSSRIRVLDPELANQIAAGEVVESPASVVKELVENALDAGASRVTVTVEGAGIELVQVVDDGMGMSAEDALLALRRHATSKISAPEDLANIATLGFRGEALPSIASVSRLSLRTKERGALRGVRVDAVPGEPLDAKPAGCPEGTTVEVRGLFFNTPARLKFLKSRSAETARVTDLFGRLALSRPEVAFTLVRGGRTVRSLLARRALAERVGEVLGAGLPLRHAVGELGPVSVVAWVTGPDRVRVGARGLHLLVNGRLVRDPGLLRAVWAAYDGTLDPGSYPLGVVSITLDPRLLDVNVHPQKAEVRFVDRGGVHGAVARVVGSVVRRGPWSSGTGDGSTPPPDARQAAEQLPFYAPEPYPGRAPAFDAGPALGGGGVPWGRAPVAAAGADREPAPRRLGRYGSLRVLGPAGSTWLVCEGPDGLVVIDQHAAHERVTFERLRAGLGKGEACSQRLLVPEQAEVSASELDELGRREDELRAIGFEVEPFGATTVTIAAVPAPLAGADPRRLLDEVLGEISGLRAPLAASMDRLLARLACHGSVRAGSRLAPEEISALLAALDETELDGHCPHGRPLAVEVSWVELERRLGRR